MTMEFDLIGVDASFANTIRQILISDVPSMAIEKVFIYNNTTIVQVFYSKLVFKSISIILNTF